MRFQCRFDIEPASPRRGPKPVRVRRASAYFAPAAVEEPSSAAHGVLAAAAVAAMVGCASSPESSLSKPMKVEPIFRVQHAMATAQGYYALGRQYDGARDWARAIDAYRKAIAVDGSHVEAYNALGVALAQSG
jgi:hypothetical protein